MSGYTKGPWLVLAQGSGVSIAHVEKHPDKTGGHRICRMHSGKPNILADAHLIAAAPELLEAAKKSAEGWDNAIELGIIPKQHIAAAKVMRDELRAAIAKAEGRG